MECWVEQDADLWWALTLRTAKKAIQQANLDPAKIRSICVSSQGITVVPVDTELKPLCNAISNALIQAVYAENAVICPSINKEKSFRPVMDVID